ncbi:MAG: FecR domain-containing protein [Verrucomicrobiota bacterium]
MKLKTLLRFALILLSAAFSLFADDFQKAKFTEVIRDVRVTAPDGKGIRDAKINDIFELPQVIRTGMDSRAELEAPDKTIARVGANTIFSFEASKRTMNLQSGSVLFHSPKGMGGGTIKTAAATAAVTGTTIMVGATSNGGFKLMVLEGSSKVTLPNGVTQRLNEGQLTFVMPGKQNQLPVIDFRLSAQTQGSSLVSGFNKPLASLDKIEKAEAKQEQNIAKGRLQNTTLRIAGDPQNGELALHDDGKGLPPIDTNPSSPTSAAALSFPEYLNSRFSKVDFVQLNGGSLNSSEIFFNAKGESADFNGRHFNISNSFGMFGANKISFSSGAGFQIPGGSQGGFNIQDFGFISNGDMQFQGAADFQGSAAQDIHFISLIGNMSFGAGTVKTAQTKAEFEAAKVMNIQGTTFNGQNFVFTGSTINVFSGTQFGTGVNPINHLDFWTQNGGFTVWENSIGNQNNGTLNFVGTSVSTTNYGQVGGQPLAVPLSNVGSTSYPDGPIGGNSNAVAHKLGGP